MNLRVATLLLSLLATVLPAQERDILITGGWLFTSTGNDRIRNPGIVIRAGKFLRVGGDLSIAAANAERVTLADTETAIPGLFDLHAHYAIELFNAGRKDETVAYPSLFLANGVTSTFPAGEMDPNVMHDLRVRIENGVEPGPRLLNSGPYFGSARPGWDRDITPQQIYAEVDHWAELGVKGFKAKGITPDELRALIERAHFHGLTVTGHLDSGNRNSVNPRDAILMGIDRIEHFMGGDAFTRDTSAYASYEHMRFDTPEFKRIAELYKQEHTYYDATLSAYGYYGKKDPAVFAYVVDEKKFLTPYMRSIVDARAPRKVNEQFENIYWTKRKEIKAFYDAGGGDLITLGTDHPSWGEFFTPFSVHRELLSLSLSGIPNAAVLRIATINSARAMELGDRLGSIEAGKWADLVVVRGNPVENIRRARQPRLVIKAGRVYDPRALMTSVEGKIGPMSAADTAVWAPTPRRGRGGSPPPSSQSPAPQQVRLADILPAGVRTTQIALTRDAKRVYYGDSARAIWFYDPADRRHVRLVDGEALDLAISPLGDALAYSRSTTATAEHHVWVLPLDPRTGLAAGREHRVGTTQGDAPSISPDGKWVAFAADDSTGVGQGVAIVPIAGGRQRVIVPFLRSGVSNVRWAPDGRSLFVGVNPPVPCDPDWSCLPLKTEFNQTTGTVRRVSVSDGSSRVVAAKVGVGWPGLAADGSMLAYTDTGFPTRVVVADTNGRALHSFQLVGRQTIEGWLNGATLVFSDRGDIRRLRSYSFNDEKVGLLVDSLDQFTDPIWSPDGTLMVGASCPPARCELRVGRADGSLVKSIPLPDRYGVGGAWSRDQRWVAYVGGPPNGDRHLNVVDLSSGTIQQLSTVRSPTVSLVWSPDSRAIIVSATIGSTAAGRRTTFERIELSGQRRSLRELALGPTPSGANAIDATTAVMLRAGELKRVVIDGDSSETILLPKHDARISGWFTTSPNQDRLAFRRTHDGDVDGDLNVLEIVNADGSGRTTIDVPFAMLNGPSALRFLPGGTQLIATALPSAGERDIAVYLVTVATKTVKKLFTIPIARFTNDLAVSPDGRTILYVANETTTPRVFTMDLSPLRADPRK